MIWYKGLNISLHSKFIILSFIIILLLFCRALNNAAVGLKSIPAIDVTTLQDVESYHDVGHEEESINTIKDLHIKVAKGDTLINILNYNGISNKEAYNLLSSLKKVYNVRKLYEGQLINLTLEEGPQPKIISLEIEIDPTKKVISIHNDQNNFDSKIIKNIRYKKLKKISHKIEGSLFSSATSNGLSDQVVMNLVNLYSKRINLNRDIKDGSKFEILLEEFVDENGQFSHDGNIIYASLTTKKKIDLYRYVMQNGNEGYFYANGDYANKHSQLQLPLKQVRISSEFGNRRHPISKKVTMHKGVDLVAPTGTPVYSASDGIVEYIGNRGGYGQYIRIKHNDYYSTAYAHLSKFSDNLKVGSSVKTGEVIANSGKTGMATGPHLHYEVLYKNKQIDPMNISSTMKVARLEGSELQRFKSFIVKIHEFVNQDNIENIGDLYSF